MAARRSSDDPRFADLMGEVEDVTPKSDKSRDGRPRPTPTTPTLPPVPGPPTAPIEFHFPSPDEPLLGHRPELRRADLRKLRAGKLRPERDVDLHGLTRVEAHRVLETEPRDAHASGERCVRVVHGRGRRSAEATSVLRAALPAWLTSPPLDAVVRAFAPAPPRDGGPGACFVWLQG